MAGRGWWFGVLGPLAVHHDGRALPLGGARQRTVLATLLVAHGRSVPVASLVDSVWNGREPASAVNTLQSYVSRLRTLLGDAPGGSDGPAPRLLGTAGGYRLDLGPAEGAAADADEDAVDVHRFERLAADGRARLADGDAHGAHARLVEALGLWRGPALADLREVPPLQAEAVRLEDLRLAAVESAAEAELACGRPAAAVDRLWRAAAEHPLREGPQALLMSALYRTGRQAEALALYGRTRRRLVDELGVEPGAGLTAVHRAILRQELLPPLPPLPPDRETGAAPDAAGHLSGPLGGPFVPHRFEVPERLEAPGFLLRPITIRDLAQDHALVTGSREQLREQFGSAWDWPPPDLTEEQDLVQLAWHQQEFTRRTSFALAVVSPGDGRLLGCVHLDPPGDRRNDADLFFWTGEGPGSALDRELSTALDHWLTTRWPWRRVARPGRTDPWPPAPPRL
ncbi:BTAD domain-containing putative transcriptional regulator [Kitasatospora sp. NPDC057965]|uniref:BTAD domain-containing putative transcriptional regulator n=1 Tax=Kitasatospora sp. NPDC057965 TaxID=3346291 RepID=UPI0036DA84D2